ncbi:MAG: aldehyde ferredoxin oxidoreductase family protein [Elusimicrobia bacterium]|nr:aldehyde ferredoxin oxidoreductase family protein [Elusimicrobiota bacterium]
MKGWTGNILRIDLTKKTHRKEQFTEEFARKWIGGRGFALKLLWDELKPGIDPLGPENKLLVVLGPIAGVPMPNSGKTIVAAKSPLTGTYADGNIGSHITIQLRKAGYDIMILEGRSAKPEYVLVEDDKVTFHPAEDLWGKGTFDTQKVLEDKYGRTAGILSIGQAGENKVLFAVVRSMEGRAGGRPGIGAVMGSKNLKAIVVKGTKEIPMADPKEMKARGVGDLKKVGDMDKKSKWSVQGTNAVLSWCNEMAALPVRNHRLSQHPEAWKLDGQRTSSARVATYGCPNCTMRCGIAIKDKEGHESEIDYENVGMLGPNLEIFDLKQMASLNYMCDDFGMDTISTGGTLSWYADAIDQGAAVGDFKFGDAEAAKVLTRKIALREGVGDLLADGSLKASRKVGHHSEAYAIQCKGLELSAYNCKYVPGQALAFGTSAIGAHHKEAWIITYELKFSERGGYGRDKAQKVVDLQRIRSSIFESLPICRFPWIELGWDLKNYPEYYNIATGANWTLDDFLRTGDRIYALLKAFWCREHPDTDRTQDYPPRVYFDPRIADKEGIIAGKHLELDKYDELLSHYYDIRGWDKRGVPTRKTMVSLGLEKEADQLAKVCKVSEDCVPIGNRGV